MGVRNTNSARLTNFRCFTHAFARACKKATRKQANRAACAVMKDASGGGGSTKCQQRSAGPLTNVFCCFTRACICSRLKKAPPFASRQIGLRSNGRGNGRGGSSILIPLFSFDPSDQTNRTGQDSRYSKRCPKMLTEEQKGMAESRASKLKKKLIRS